MKRTGAATLSLVFLGLVFTPSVANGDTLAHELIAYWAFDEGQGGIASDSVGINDGTILGAAWTNGNSGYALRFDGVNDYVRLPASEDFEFGFAQLSISAWIKTTDLHREQYVVSFYAPGNTPHIEIYTANGRLGTHLLPTDTRITDGLVADNQWHHVVITLANGASDGFRLYLDGTPVGSTRYSGNLAGWETVSIGARDLGYPNEPFDGVIDEVAIFDKALSAEKVNQIYLEGLISLPAPTFDSGWQRCELTSGGRSVVTIRHNLDTRLEQLTIKTLFRRESFFFGEDSYRVGIIAEPRSVLMRGRNAIALIPGCGRATTHYRVQIWTHG